MTLQNIFREIALLTYLLVMFALLIITASFDFDVDVAINSHQGALPVSWP
jgi:hypothetical protein